MIAYWLGGAGMVLKTTGGKVICVDPYLSDCVERMFGFRRLSLAPVAAQDLNFDVLLITHDHADHLDMDSISMLHQLNPRAQICAPTDCIDAIKPFWADVQAISPGEVVQCDDISVKAIKADHGELAPNAIGYMLTVEGRTIYITGDTCYSSDIIDDVSSQNPDIVICCINGAFGNLNSSEAASVVAKCKPKLVIPYHFWLFAEHGGNPQEFLECVNKESPSTQVLLLTPGRGVEI